MGYIYHGYPVKTLAEFQGKTGGQDYETIKKNLQPGIPFVDPEFSGENDSTLGKKASSSMIFWARAKDVTPNPVFVTPQVKGESKASRFDIIQGALSDCWLLVAVDVIAEHPALLKMVVPKENTFADDNSVFHFRFWRCGYWVDVVIDDMLPCYLAADGNQGIITKVAFARNRENEFWVPLLEKAYAKLYGSYSMLQFGLIGDALVDLTGGICRTLTLRAPLSEPPKLILNFMAEAYERGSLIGLGIMLGTNATGDAQVGAGEIKQANGLAQGHAYSVTGLGQVKYEGKNVLLVRIRNPWATSYEWNGAWSDSSVEWKTFSRSKVDKVKLNKEDGEFWMTYEDMMKNFDLLSVCHLPSKLAKQLETPRTEIWTNHEFHGTWTGAGGENAVELFKNPQYLLDLNKDDSNTLEDMTCVISIYNKGVRLTGKDTVPQTFFAVIFKLNLSSERITKRFRANSLENNDLEMIGRPSPEDMRESYELSQLPKGRYVIIPIFGSIGGVKGTFILRVYTNRKSRMTELQK